MRYLFLLLTFAFTAELEVDGVIKANSGIDANNNPITKNQKLRSQNILD